MTREQQIRNRRKRRMRQRRRQRRILISIMLILLLTVVGIGINIWRTSRKEEKGQPGKKTAAKEQKREEKESSAEIRLTENESIKINLGETFQEPGYQAKDKDGSDLTDKVTVDTSGLNRAGSQKVIYTVKGNNGLEKQVTRDVEVLPNTNYETNGLAICMFHYVYDKNQIPDNLNSNFISTEALEEEMKYLRDQNYYFPTWQEVRDYVDGKLLLPENSIVITFDDSPTLMNLGIPILEKYQTPATSFVITGSFASKENLYGYASDYLHFETHSNNMHRAGGSIGHGGIYTALSDAEVTEDLTQSIKLCGNGNAFAYPFGDYTQEQIPVLEQIGLLCAVTTKNQKCYPGDNPYILPRVRMSDGQSLEQFIAKIR